MFSDKHLVKYVVQCLLFSISWLFLADFCVIIRARVGGTQGLCCLHQEFSAFDKINQQGPGVDYIQR